MRPAHDEPAAEASRARAHQRLSAQHAVARIVAEAESLARAGPSILQAICECLDWDVGALWIVDRDAHRIRCVETWLAAGVTAPAFVAASRALVAEAGQGLPGHAWRLGNPVWIDDLPEAGPVFVRGDIAAREGLHGAIAFPIVLGNEVLGVMDFLTHEIRRPDTDVLEMLSTFGSQIGQFIERKRVEEALRVSEQRLQAIIDQVSATDDDTSLAVLSARERQVLQLIAESKTNLEIGQILHISPHTVDTHRRKMMEKLDLHNVVDLVKFAIRNGLARVDSGSRRVRPRRGRSTSGCAGC